MSGSPLAGLVRVLEGAKLGPVVIQQALPACVLPPDRLWDIIRRVLRTEYKPPNSRSGPLGPSSRQRAPDLCVCTSILPFSRLPTPPETARAAPDHGSVPPQPPRDPWAPPEPPLHRVRAPTLSQRANTGPAAMLRAMSDATVSARCDATRKSRFRNVRRFFHTAGAHRGAMRHTTSPVEAELRTASLCTRASRVQMVHTTSSCNTPRSPCTPATMLVTGILARQRPTTPLPARRLLREARQPKRQLAASLDGLARARDSSPTLLPSYAPDYAVPIEQSHYLRAAILAHQQHHLLTGYKHLPTDEPMPGGTQLRVALPRGIPGPDGVPLTPLQFAERFSHFAQTAARRVNAPYTPVISGHGESSTELVLNVECHTHAALLAIVLTARIPTEGKKHIPTRTAPGQQLTHAHSPVDGHNTYPIGAGAYGAPHFSYSVPPRKGRGPTKAPMDKVVIATVKVHVDNLTGSILANDLPKERLIALQVCHVSGHDNNHRTGIPHVLSLRPQLTAVLQPAPALTVPTLTHPDNCMQAKRAMTAVLRTMADEHMARGRGDLRAQQHHLDKLLQEDDVRTMDIDRIAPIKGRPGTCVVVCDSEAAANRIREGQVWRLTATDPALAKLMVDVELKVQEAAATKLDYTELLHHSVVIGNIDARAIASLHKLVAHVLDRIIPTAESLMAIGYNTLKNQVASIRASRDNPDLQRPPVNAASLEFLAQWTALGPNTDHKPALHLRKIDGTPIHSVDLLYDGKVAPAAMLDVLWVRGRPLADIVSLTDGDKLLGLDRLVELLDGDRLRVELSLADRRSALSVLLASVFEFHKTKAPSLVLGETSDKPVFSPARAMMGPRTKIVSWPDLQQRGPPALVDPLAVITALAHADNAANYTEMKTTVEASVARGKQRFMNTFQHLTTQTPLGRRLLKTIGMPAPMGPVVPPRDAGPAMDIDVDAVLEDDDVSDLVFDVDFFPDEGDTDLEDGGVRRPNKVGNEAAVHTLNQHATPKQPGVSTSPHVMLACVSDTAVRQTHLYPPGHVPYSGVRVLSAPWQFTDRRPHPLIHYYHRRGGPVRMPMLPRRLPKFTSSTLLAGAVRQSSPQSASTAYAGGTWGNHGTVATSVPRTTTSAGQLGARGTDCNNLRGRGQPGRPPYRLRGMHFSAMRRPVKRPRRISAKLARTKPHLLGAQFKRLRTPRCPPRAAPPAPCPPGAGHVLGGGPKPSIREAPPPPINPAVRTDGQERVTASLHDLRMYCEPQRGHQCGIHALNALVGTRLATNDNVLAYLRRVWPEGADRDYGPRGYTSSALNIWLAGNCRPPIALVAALSTTMYSGAPHCSYTKEHILSNLPPECDRFMMWIPECGGHYVCIRRHAATGLWFYLDSMDCGSTKIATAMLDTDWAHLKGIFYFAAAVNPMHVRGFERPASIENIPDNLMVEVRGRGHELPLPDYSALERIAPATPTTTATTNRERGVRPPAHQTTKPPGRRQHPAPAAAHCNRHDETGSQDPPRAARHSPPAIIPNKPAATELPQCNTAPATSRHIPAKASTKARSTKRRTSGNTSKRGTIDIRNYFAPLQELGNPRGTTPNDDHGVDPQNGTPATGAAATTQTAAPQAPPTSNVGLGHSLGGTVPNAQPNTTTDYRDRDAPTPRRDTISIVTWNVRGLTRTSHELQTIASQHNPDVIILTETKLTDRMHGKTYVRDSLQGYSPRYSSVPHGTMLRDQSHYDGGQPVDNHPATLAANAAAGSEVIANRSGRAGVIVALAHKHAARPESITTLPCPKPLKGYIQATMVAPSGRFLAGPLHSAASTDDRLHPLQLLLVGIYMPCDNPLLQDSVVDHVIGIRAAYPMAVMIISGDMNMDRSDPKVQRLCVETHAVKLELNGPDMVPPVTHMCDTESPNATHRELDMVFVSLPDTVAMHGTSHSVLEHAGLSDHVPLLTTITLEGFPYAAPPVAQPAVPAQPSIVFPIKVDDLRKFSRRVVATHGEDLDAFAAITHKNSEALVAMWHKLQDYGAMRRALACDPEYTWLQASHDTACNMLTTLAGKIADTAKQCLPTRVRGKANTKKYMSKSAKRKMGRHLEDCKYLNAIITIAKQSLLALRGTSDGGATPRPLASYQAWCTTFVTRITETHERCSKSRDRLISNPVDTVDDEESNRAPMARLPLLPDLPDNPPDSTAALAASVSGWLHPYVLVHKDSRTALWKLKCQEQRNRINGIVSTGVRPWPPNPGRRTSTFSAGLLLIYVPRMTTTPSHTCQRTCLSSGTRHRMAPPPQTPRPS